MILTTKQKHLPFQCVQGVKYIQHKHCLPDKECLQYKVVQLTSYDTEVNFSRSLPWTDEKNLVNFISEVKRYPVHPTAQAFTAKGYMLWRSSGSLSAVHDKG